MLFWFESKKEHNLHIRMNGECAVGEKDEIEILYARLLCCFD